MTNTQHELPLKDNSLQGFVEIPRRSNYGGRYVIQRESKKEDVDRPSFKNRVADYRIG